MAILILLQVTKLADRWKEGENWISETVGPSHTSIGALLLGLIVLRVVWAMRHPGQRPAYVGRTAALAKLGHMLMYVAMLIMPITGMLFMIGNGYGLKFFGVQLLDKGPEIDWSARLGNIHSPLAWLLVALVAGHIMATLHHHFVLRDNTWQHIT